MPVEWKETTRQPLPPKPKRELRLQLSHCLSLAVNVDGKQYDASIFALERLAAISDTEARAVALSWALREMHEALATLEIAKAEADKAVELLQPK